MAQLNAIFTKTLGTTEKVIVKRYGDGTIAYTPQLVTNVTTVSGSPNLSGVVSTNGISAGDPISGTGIPAGATVLSFVANTSIVMSANATASATVAATINKSHKAIGEHRTQSAHASPMFLTKLFAALNIVA